MVIGRKFIRNRKLGQDKMQNNMQMIRDLSAHTAVQMFRYSYIIDILYEEEEFTVNLGRAPVLKVHLHTLTVHYANF